MNHGDARIALAKIYNVRKGWQRAAADLLRGALRLSKDDISDDAKKEAESLLKQLGKM
jgi:hypothetical protein